MTLVLGIQDLMVQGIHQVWATGRQLETVFDRPRQ